MVSTFWQLVTYTQNWAHVDTFQEWSSPFIVFMARPAYYGHEFWLNIWNLKFLLSTEAFDQSNPGVYEPPVVTFDPNACLACTGLVAYYDIFFTLSGVQNAKLSQSFFLEGEGSYASLFNTLENPIRKGARRSWSLSHGWGRPWDVARWLATSHYPGCSQSLDHLIGRPGRPWPQCRLPAPYSMLSPIYTHGIDSISGASIAFATPAYQVPLNFSWMSDEQYYAYWRATVGHPISDLYNSAPATIEQVHSVRWRADVADTTSVSREYQAREIRRIYRRREALKRRTWVDDEAPFVFLAGHGEDVTNAIPDFSCWLFGAPVCATL